MGSQCEMVVLVYELRYGVFRMGLIYLVMVQNVKYNDLVKLLTEALNEQLNCYKN